MYLTALLLVAGLSGCKKETPDPEPEDYSALVANLGNSVILTTYQDLANDASLLLSACQLLETDPTTAHLEAARNAWVTARTPWEQSEGFLFGPVDQEGLDPSLDSWPVNEIDLNNVLASSDALTLAFLQQQEGTLKGFHTIEFLLWGTSSNKEITDFTAREFEYLSAAAAALSADATELYNLWRPGSGNFIDNVLTAGNGSVVYISQKSVIEEFTNALIIIADEVGNGKINDPFAQQDLTLEESRFSTNSKADFADNIRSIQHIYLGTYGNQGNNQGISTLIQSEDAGLDARVQTEIITAIDAIEGIPGTFSDAIFNNPTAVANAQQAVRTLQETLEGDVLPLISNL